MSSWFNFFTVFTLAATSLLSASKVFVLQDSNNASQLSIYSGNPLVLQNTITTVSQPSIVLANPQGTRVYVLGRSGNVAVLDPKANYAQLVTYSFGGSQIQKAVIAGNGQQLLVLADTLRVIDIRPGAPDKPENTSAITGVGSLPNDIALSLDSKTAYVTSQVSRTVTAVNLSTRQVIAQEELNELPSGVTVSPNGLVYVSCANRLYEIDGQNGLRFTVAGGFSFNANVGSPVASPDGSKVMMLNPTNTTFNAVVYVDVRKREVKTANSPVPLKNLLIASNTVAYALGTNGIAYQMHIDNLQEPSQANVGFPLDLVSLAISDESSDARYLYGQTSNRLIRYDRLGAGQQLVEVGTISPAKAIIYSDDPSTESVAKLQVTALSAPLPPNSQSFPLAVKSLDIAGRPVSNEEITFSSTAAGVVLQETKARTNSQGVAAVWANLPSLVGSYIVNATSASGGSVQIPIQVQAQTIGKTEFTIIRGNGQISTGGQALNEILTARLTDALGRPVPGVTVKWTLKSGGPTIQLTNPTSVTNAQGYAENGITSFTFQKHIFQFVPYSIDATLTYEEFNGAVQFNGIVYPTNAAPPYINLKTTLRANNGEFHLPAGEVIANAFEVEVRTSDAAPLPVPLPNVGIRAFTPNTADTLVKCQNAPVSGQTGKVKCDLVVGTTLGSTSMRVVVGELPAPQYNFNYGIRIVAGSPRQVEIIRGDGQSGLPGEKARLALVAVIADAGGNILTGIPVSWSISSGDGELINTRKVTDHTGHVSTEYKFGNTPGPVSIQVTAGSVSRTFTLTNDAPTGALSIAGGNSQRAQLDADFKTPLAVKVTTGSNLPLPGAMVQFEVKSGPVLLEKESAVTDDQGVASVKVKAGSEVGAAVVTATLGASSVEFKLTVDDVNPQIESVLNGASFQEGTLATCAVTVIRGTGFAAGLDGVISGTPGEDGSQPYTLEGIGVKVGDKDAPIFYVSSIEGVDQIGIQLPCDLPAGEATLQLTAQGTETTKTINVSDIAPGIFETEFVAGEKQAVVVKEDGSYVSPENPAIRGETLTGFFTGLQPTTDPRTTNKVGEGQVADISRIIVGMTGRGMPGISAQYEPGVLGVYTVKFLVGADAVPGDRQAYSIGVINAAGEVIYSNTSYLPIRAN